MLKILDQLGHVKVKSITDILFKYGAIILGMGVISAIAKCETWIIITIFLLSGLFLILGLIFYAYFALNNPDYLRSEIYQLRKKSLDLIGDKENFQNPNIINISSITSPYDNKDDQDTNKKLG